jgi:DNA-binding transcriptional MerR regulator
MAAGKRDVFKAADVCEMAQLQPYVLRSWEAEFPGLGQAVADGGPRLYRRADVQLVLRIKQLVFDEGLTLAGARRRLEEIDEPSDGAALTIEDVVGGEARDRIRHVREGLLFIKQMLSRDQQEMELLLVAPAPPVKVKKAIAKARRR